MRRARYYQRVAAAARLDPRLSNVGLAIATLFVCLGVLDVLSTEWALAVGAYEANALMRGLQDLLGPTWYVPKLALQATVGAMIVWSPNRATIAIMTLICGWTSSVVSSNFLIALSLS